MRATDPAYTGMPRPAGEPHNGFSLTPATAMLFDQVASEPTRAVDSVIKEHPYDEKIPLFVDGRDGRR
jgi:hypothetical protein